MRRLIVTLMVAALSAIAAPVYAGVSIPVYPGAKQTVRPVGVGMKAPPKSAKTYATPDDFARVNAWYASHLQGATEVPQPGLEKVEDAYLIGQGSDGMVVLIQRYRGETYIVIGPPK